MDWPLVRIWIALIGVMTYWAPVECSLSGWKKTPTQYHVQTDEGSERYFRFQTYNGQYRRERRLDDGTVVGSYGWVDPTGFLRMTDYIADSKGYRIVKEFMEFVGTNSIDDGPQKYSASKQSLRVAKPLGIFTKKPSTTDYYEASSESSTSAVTLTTPQPPVAYNTTLKAPVNYYETPKSSSISLESLRRPSPPTRRVYAQPSPATPPQKVFVPPKPPHRVSKVLATTNSPADANSYVYVPQTSNYARKPSSNTNSLYFKGASLPERQPDSSSTRNATYASPGRFPARRRPTPVPTPASHELNTPEEIQDGYQGKEEDVFQAYTTPLRRVPGFLYKVPHQYHKEETEDDGSRTGSFGYVDPYGIRRVIHYSAGETGFQHQRDFQFVGRQY